MFAVFWLLFLCVRVFLVTFDSLIMVWLNFCHCKAYKYSNLQFTARIQHYVELHQQEQTIFSNSYCLHNKHIYVCS